VTTRRPSPLLLRRSGGGLGLRRGMTLIEIMVVMAIIALVTAVAIPSLSAVFAFQQRGAVKELAQTYTWLIDEAALRNVTFRIVYSLDRRTWKVEVGDPDTLVFATPEEREKADEELRDEMSRYTESELEAGAADAEADEEEDGASSGRFEGLTGDVFTSEQELPSGTMFLFVYTPQYPIEGVRPSDEPPEDPADEAVAYSYVFADGSTEHTLVRIVDSDDQEDGYTLEVEPGSGRVRIENEELSPEDALAWLPEEGPELP
jgi:prepilin-type N-terminal cleavage/methylation domain-containing protein